MSPPARTTDKTADRRNLRFETLEDWLRWQETLHPADIELGLERLRPVWARLRENDLGRCRVVVGGTNGKGSTVALLEAIWLAAGYRVGCYTSPHLLRYNERLRIQGEAVSDAALCQAFAAVDAARGDSLLTYFEFGTLAALWLLQGAGLDVVILEVGLGGRLDAVNLVDGDVAVITSIDLDPQQWLGDTREAIAAEKFGIARRGRALVLGEPEPPANLPRLAREQGVILRRQGHEFSARDEGAHWSWRGEKQRIPGLPRPALPGRHQLRNAATALEVVNLLHGQLPVSRAELRRGLATVSLPGRFQVCHEGGRRRILDVAHNPQACRALADNLRSLPPAGKRIAVLGMLADKDAAASLTPLLDSFDQWHLADLEAARSASAETLAAVLWRLRPALRVQCHASVSRALAAAEAECGADDWVVVFGSFYTVAEALRDE